MILSNLEVATAYRLRHLPQAFLELNSEVGLAAIRNSVLQPEADAWAMLIAELDCPGSTLDANYEEGTGLCSEELTGMGGPDYTLPLSEEAEECAKVNSPTRSDIEAVVWETMDKFLTWIDWRAGATKTRSPMRTIMHRRVSLCLVKAIHSSTPKSGRLASLGLSGERLAHAAENLSTRRGAQFCHPRLPHTNCLRWPHHRAGAQLRLRPWAPLRAERGGTGSRR